MESGAGGRYSRELCGLNVLYSFRQRSISTWAGKSTTLKTILGVLRPAKGTIEFRG